MIHCLSLSTRPHGTQLILYWLGDLMSLNQVPSTIDSEAPILQKINLIISPVKWVKVQYKGLGLPPAATLTLTFT